MLRLFTNLVALRAVSDKLLWIAFALFHQVLGRYAAVRPPPTDGFGQYLNNPSLYPPATVDDGRATLILHAYLSKMADELRRNRELNFTQQQSEFVIHRLRGLYNHLKDHPALMDSRLAVGSRLPSLKDPSGEDNSITHYGPAKRKVELPMTEACPSITEWLTLNKSRDILDHEVEVFQPNGSEEEAHLGAQFFYTTRCINGVENEACLGASFLYSTRCLTRRGYVMALVRKKPDEAFDWNWIQVAVSCNCGVIKKF